MGIPPATTAGLARECGDGHGRRALTLTPGDERIALELARHGWAVSALDADAITLARGRAQADAENLVVDWRPALTGSLPYPDGTFALVVAAPSLQRTARFAEIRRCLQEGGQLRSLDDTAAPESST